MNEQQVKRARVKIDILSKEISSLEVKKKKLIKDFQNECPHESIIECDYKPMYFGDALPPMRVCRDCGLSEDGWGIGYEKLKTEFDYTEKERLHIPLVSREIVYQHRL